MPSSARDHRRGIVGRCLQALQAKCRRGCKRLSNWRGDRRAGRRHAGANVVERHGMLGRDQRGAAGSLHAGDRRVAPVNLVRDHPPGIRQDREHALALRTHDLVPNPGNGLAFDGRGRIPFEHAAAVRRRVADADHGSL